MLGQMCHALGQVIDDALGVPRPIVSDVGADLAQARLGTVGPDNPHRKPKSRRTQELSATRAAALSDKSGSISRIVSTCLASSSQPAVSGSASTSLCVYSLNTAATICLRWIDDCVLRFVAGGVADPAL